MFLLQLKPDNQILKTLLQLLWNQSKIYRIHARQILFMFDADSCSDLIVDQCDPLGDKKHRSNNESSLLTEVVVNDNLISKKRSSRRYKCLD